MIRKRLFRPIHLTLMLILFAITFYGEAAYAALRQGASITQSGTPATTPIAACSGTYLILIDGATPGTPGFCPTSGQTGYSVTITFNRPVTEYATRIAIWANTGVIVDDHELRIFDMQIVYVDPLTRQQLTYTQTNVQIPDTTSAEYPNLPVYYNLPFNMYGLVSLRMSNLRNIPITGQSNDEAPFREVQIDTTVDAGRATNVQMSKTSALYSGNPPPNFAIPANDVLYTLTVTNAGNLGVDSNSLFLVDPLPSQVTFFNGDADGAGAGTGAVQFTGTGGGLTFPAGSFAYATSAPANFAACNYTPAAGYDPLVRYICIRPTGVLYGANASPYPTFSALFRVRIN